MKSFIKDLLIFIIIGFAIGEVIARCFSLTSDIPRRYVDESGIQKYLPNQEGTWIGGEHSWQINAKGWPGKLPAANDNLVTIIGDSFIENFMNPNECHQASYLLELLPQYNFMEAGRSGVSFIEAMEISRQLDSLHPKMHLIYVHVSDFSESIIQIARRPDITQIDLDKEKVIPGTLKAPKLKLILYNWKFMYYLYNRLPINLGQAATGDVQKGNKTRSPKKNDGLYHEELLSYVAENFKTDDKILVFGPGSDKNLGELAKKYGFDVLHLDNKNDKKWSFEYDSHWTCYGHQRVAEQVSEKIKNKVLRNSNSSLK